MAISPAKCDREQAKFKETSTGKTAVRVCADSSDPIPVSITTGVAGNTDHFNGTVGTVAISVPGVAGDTIDLAIVRNPVSNSNNKDLLASFDGGAGYITMSPGEFIIWPVLGAQTEIKIKGSVAGVAYEVILNRVA